MRCVLSVLFGWVGFGWIIFFGGAGKHIELESGGDLVVERTRENQFEGIGGGEMEGGRKLSDVVVEFFERFEEEFGLMGAVIFCEVVLLETDEVVLKVDDFQWVVGLIEMEVESGIVWVWIEGLDFIWEFSPRVRLLQK
jgi:hypothetical protein